MNGWDALRGICTLFEIADTFSKDPVTSTIVCGIVIGIVIIGMVIYNAAVERGWIKPPPEPEVSNKFDRNAWLHPDKDVQKLPETWIDPKTDPLLQDDPPKTNADPDAALKRSWMDDPSTSERDPRE